jgi:hypothetical protein
MSTDHPFDAGGFFQDAPCIHDIPVSRAPGSPTIPEYKKST